MLTRLKFTPLFAALAALLLVAGTATAAKLITGKDIKNNSLSGLDIKNGSVKAKDISPATRSALTGAAGPAGPQGDPGAKGDAGAPGAPGAAAPTGFMGRSSGLSTGTIQYEFGYVNGAGSAVADAGDRTMLSPAVAMRATRIDAKFSAPPGGTSTRAIRLRVNGENTDLFCVVEGGQAACSGTGDVAIPPNAEVAVQHLSGLTAPDAASAIYSITVERA